MIKLPKRICAASVGATFCLFVSANAQIITPADYSGLALWLDANDVNGNGITPANNSTVTTWVDKSAGAHHLTAAVANAPTYQATGFNGVNPAIRFALNKFLAGANPFGATTQSAITFFTVQGNNTLTQSAPFSLNGNNEGSAALGGRYYMHTPWSDNVSYFDAGGCCSTHRLSAAFPNALTETTIFAGLSDGVSRSQLLRIDGAAIASGTTADAVRVDQGTRINVITGGTSSFDGRFGEIIVYNRALSIAEIRWVECYLLEKWKPSKMPSTCKPTITASKSVSTWNDGVNPPFNTPGTDVTYTLNVQRSAGVRVSKDSIFVVDRLPAAMTFFNGDANGAGPGTAPIIFNGAGTGLTFTYATDARFATGSTAPSSFSACGYAPAAGYDPNVRFICLNPKGAFVSGASTANFNFQFRARIN